MTSKSSFIPRIMSQLTIISSFIAIAVNCNQPKKSGIEIPLYAYIAANTGAALCLMYWLHACYQCGRQQSGATDDSTSDTTYSSISTEPSDLNK